MEPLIPVTTCQVCGRQFRGAEAYADHVEQHVQRVRTFEARQGISVSDRCLLFALRIAVPEGE